MISKNKETDIFRIYRYSFFLGVGKEIKIMQIVILFIVVDLVVFF